MDKLTALEWGQDRFTILGGTFKPESWAHFLNTWIWPTKDARWGLWEYSSESEINEGQLPADAQYSLLERGEVFGNDGHLSMRRDGEIVYWHFVGGTSLVPPKDFSCEYYWKTHATEKFRRTQRTMLLWGERVSGEQAWWHDDRVARAVLKYPGVTSERGQLNYYEFTCAGQIAFVWFTGLSNYVG